eukprot:gi/632979720/ref/XP_007906628.1/ PREDICTED: protein CASP-like [Callorhinchus milii]
MRNDGMCMSVCVGVCVHVRVCGYVSGVCMSVLCVVCTCVVCVRVSVCMSVLCVFVCLCRPQGGSSNATEQRYSSQYEERLDPFTSFSRKERQRRYLSLSPWDKATLSMGRIILSNKMARTIAFFYTVLLHCLVFLVLYRVAWSESVGRDCTAYCAKKYADHLHEFHEDGGAKDMWQ